MSTVFEALEQLKKGGLIVVVDDEDRENEGDLIGSAELATKDMINFMATYGKGLICMPMSQERADKLELSPMVNNNTDNHQTAFTQSIDYVESTTGISAEERAITAIQAAQTRIKAKDFRRPGHMFPLVAKELGLFERRGHTEATVDLMRLANLSDCGLCCEIMNREGEMMRITELTRFAKRHNLPIISVQQILDYRKENEQLIKLNNMVDLPTKYGMFKLYSFTTPFSIEPELAIVKGNIKNKDEVLCRLHSECLTGDVFGSLRCDCGLQLETALKAIEQNGSGVVLYLRQEGRGIGLVNKLKAYKLQEKGYDTLQANLELGFSGDEREYFVAAQILKYLMVNSINLLTNNPHKVKQLSNNGIVVAERTAIEIEANPYDATYLKTKKDKMGHILTLTKKVK